MPQAFAEFESRVETLDGKLAFAEAPVGQSAEVKTVGFPPGVLAVRMFRPVERMARVLEGFAGVASREVTLNKLVGCRRPQQKAEET